MSKAGQLPGLFYGFFRGTAGQATLRWLDVASVAEPARLGSGIPRLDDDSNLPFKKIICV
jgi:hypothetical protein